MSLNLGRPLGDATTVLDIADRDEMDDDMFPLDTSKSWFTRDSERRVLNFSPVVQEFVHKGSAEFGNRLVFEIGSVKACDLLFSVALQIRLGHWFPPNVVAAIQTGLYTYQDPSQAWLRKLTWNGYDRTRRVSLGRPSVGNSGWRFLQHV